MCSPAPPVSFTPYLLNSGGPVSLNFNLSEENNMLVE
jgi:hypothetical protein